MSGNVCSYHGNQCENLTTKYQKPKHKYLVTCYSSQHEVNKVEKKKEFGESYSRMVLNICKQYFLLSALAKLKYLCNILTLLFIYWYFSGFLGLNVFF